MRNISLDMDHVRRNIDWGKHLHIKQIDLITENKNLHSWGLSKTVENRTTSEWVKSGIVLENDKKAYSILFWPLLFSFYSIS